MAFAAVLEKSHHRHDVYSSADCAGIQSTVSFMHLFYLAFKQAFEKYMRARTKFIMSHPQNIFF